MDQAVKHNVPPLEIQPKFLSFQYGVDEELVVECMMYQLNPTDKKRLKGCMRGWLQNVEIIYWNIRSRHDNVPTRFDEMGTTLVSGFSPSIMKSILSCQI